MPPELEYQVYQHNYAFAEVVHQVLQQHFAANADVTEYLDTSHEVEPAVVTEMAQTAAQQDFLADETDQELGQEEPVAGHKDAVELSGLDVELEDGIAAVVQEACWVIALEKEMMLAEMELNHEMEEEQT